MTSPLLLPDWPAPAGVRALCSTRLGGVSRPPWDSFNLGDHVGDDPAAVAANRAAWARHLGARPVFLNQVHGTHTVRLDAATADGTVADACVADTPGVACTIMVADCLPVLLCDTRGTRVGAAHAGWRGLAGQGGTGVIESLAAAFDPAHTLAWLGPCIGPRAFEVGPEVKAAFESVDAAAGTLFACQGHGKWLADLPGLARRRLAALGITRIHGNDGSDGWCTVTAASRFFSHRRDRVSGRLAASVWLA
ncbi:peptidoglycan editing factor PgeF [Ramlibacter sp. MAHUQ-53]|uniref:peptidoglycan editing factor PgeF n=1 Tax=unclassified Ramlibacter TaxID=2617605 RepID=UPI0036369EF1